MKKLFNLIAPLFILIRYYNKRDPFKLFKKTIGKNKELSAGMTQNKKNLLLAPIRVTPMSNLFEGLIGYFYKNKGYQVKAIMCDQAVHYCDHIVHADESKRLMICALCQKEQKRFCDTFGIEKISLREHISQKQLLEVEGFIEKQKLADSNLPIIFRNIDFSKQITSAVTRYTLKSEIDTNTEGHIFYGYMKTVLLTYIASENIFNETKTEKIILSHGVYSLWGTVLQAAQERKIPTYVWARGYVGQGNLLFGHNKSYLEDIILEDKKIYQSIDVSVEDLEKTREYFRNKRNPKSQVEYVNYYQNIDVKSDVETQLKELNNFSKIFGMFTNIPWDGQIFNLSKEFPSTKNYVSSVIKWFEVNRDCALVIRAHPAECGRTEGRGAEKFYDVLNRLYPILPNNIFYLPPNSSISSYKLASKIDAAIIFGSSIGLEIAISGTIVIQAGRFNTTKKDIVFEAKDEKHLHEYFEAVRLGSLKMTQQQRDNALKFAYYWINKRHIPDDTVKLKNLVFEDYTFKTIEEFLDSRTLNFIYNKIENNQKLILT